MTIGNFDTIFKLVIGEEGGYVNDPKDRGGPTKFGVTQATLSAWRRHPVQAADVQRLGIDEAKLIFKMQYWDKVQGNKLPPGVDLCVTDAAFNSGPGRAAKLLQQTLGVTQDGVVGEKTLAALGTRQPEDVVEAFSRNRLAFLKTTYGWGRFGKGWTNRVNRVRDTAHDMVDAIPVGVADLPPMEGGAEAHDQALAKTPSGKAKIVASIGAVGTAATDAAQQVQPLMDFLPTLKWIFVALTVVGIGIGFWVQVKQLQAEARS